LSGYSEASVARLTPAKIIPAVDLLLRKNITLAPAAPATTARFQFSMLPSKSEL
jgi:hypothetical protein